MRKRVESRGVPVAERPGPRELGGQRLGLRSSFLRTAP